MAPPPRMSDVFSRVYGLLHAGYNPGNATWRAVQDAENDVVCMTMTVSYGSHLL